MIRTYLNHLPKNFLAFPVVPLQMDWESIPESLTGMIDREAKNAVQTEISRLLMTDWMQFFRTGARRDYEIKCFSRRKQLRDLAYGILLKEEPGMRDVLMNVITAICEETAWQLPANNFYIAGTPPLQWPDPEQPVIDLPAAQTGGLLACCHHALANVLAPSLRARMMYEVERRLIAPYVEEHFWWMAAKNQPACAWTAQGTIEVLLCAFVMPFSYEVRRKVLRRAVYSLEYFLDLYTENGQPNEAVDDEYHGLLSFFGCLSILSFTAAQPFEKVWKEPKVLAMAKRLMSLSAPFEDPVQCAQEFAVALRVSEPGWAFSAAQRWHHEMIKEVPAAGIDLWAALVQAANAARMTEWAENAEHAQKEKTTFQRGRWAVSACAERQEGTAHLGSISLSWQDRPVLIEVEDGTYTQTTPSGKQFEIFPEQSQWHNLPTFNGVMQTSGGEACVIAEKQESEAEFRLSMELNKVWPASAHVSSVVRTLVLNETGLFVEDVCAGTYSFAFSSLMLAERPILHDTFAEFGELTIYWNGVTAPVEVDELSVLDEAHLKQWGDTIYRLRLPFASSLKIRIEQKQAEQPEKEKFQPFLFEKIERASLR